MRHFTLECHSSLSPEEIFGISINVGNFQDIMPDYFEAIDIIEKDDRGIVADEIIKFLGLRLKVRTRHVIREPDIHEVHILTGPARGTLFVESYLPSGDGTMISIDVTLRFPGVMRLFFIFEGMIAGRMGSVMKKFVMSAEKFHASGLQPG